MKKRTVIVSSHRPEIPDRKLYPQIYHWYIILKQFAATTREKWAQQEDDDELIAEIIKESEEDSAEEVEDKLNCSPMSEPSPPMESNFRGGEGFLKLHSGDATTFTLNITFKESISDKLREIVSRISKEK